MNKIILLSLFSALLAPYCCFCMKPSADAQYRRDLARAIAESKVSAARTAQPFFAPMSRTATQRVAPKKSVAHTPRAPQPARKPVIYQHAPTKRQQPRPSTSIHNSGFSESDIERAITESLKENAQPTSVHSSGIRVTHYQTNLQKGLECGFRAVLNARAIENIIELGGVLSDQTIKAQEKILYDQEQSRAPVTQNLTIDNVGLAAQRLGLTNLYALGIDHNGVIYTPGNGELSIRESIELMKQIPDFRVLHFVINTGGHWVVLSLIKQAADNYSIVHVDSMNGKINTRVQPYIDYINGMVQST